MKVGDLVRYGEYLGIVTCIDPEEIGDNEEVEVTWIDGDVGNASTRYLEVVSEQQDSKNRRSGEDEAL
jgi:hypothetical protein